MNKLIGLIFIFALFSCAPQKLEQKKEIENNSAEIVVLEERIKELNQKIAELYLASGSMSDELSMLYGVADRAGQNSDIEEKLNIFRTELLAAITSLETRLDSRISKLESQYALFKQKLDQPDDRYVSLSDFETLRMDFENDYTRKQALNDIRIIHATTMGELNRVKRNQARIDQERADTENEYKNYLNTALVAWTARLESYIDQKSLSQGKPDKLKPFFITEFQRVNTTIETLKLKIADLEKAKEEIVVVEQLPAQSSVSNPIETQIEFQTEYIRLQKIIRENEKTNTDYLVKLGQLIQELKENGEFDKETITALQDQQNQINLNKLNNAAVLVQLESMQITIDQLRGQQEQLALAQTQQKKAPIADPVTIIKPTFDYANAIEELRVLMASNTEQIADEGLRISILKEDFQNIQSQEKRKNYQAEIGRIESLLEQNRRLYAKISNQAQRVMGKSVASDVIEKLYEPCKKGLKTSAYCYTLGTMITRLGGQFIDPTGFKMTQKDFVRYLNLSGVTLKAAIENSSSYLTPSSRKNKAKLRRCNGRNGLTKNIPPHILWPRAVLLSLVMEKIEKDLNLQKKLRYIGADIVPFKRIESWYRGACYHKALTGNSSSDHISAAAFDPSFVNKASFKFYRNFIKQYIWDNDTFGIVHPLKSANLKFSTGIGLGHGSRGNGKMHIGIASEVQFGSRPGEMRNWKYGNYKDLFKRK